MDTLRRLISVGIIMGMVWFSAAVVNVATYNTMLQEMAVGLAFLTTLIVGIVAALTEISRKPPSSKPAEESREKAKRRAYGADAGQDARLALLLAMLNDEQHYHITQQLIDDLTADGEALPLSDLLAAQERDRYLRR